MKLKKCICQLIAMLLLAPVFAGCRNGTPPDDETETQDSAAATTSPQEDDPATLILAENGQSDFTIWLARDL